MVGANIAAKKFKVTGMSSELDSTVDDLVWVNEHDPSSPVRTATWAMTKTSAFAEVHKWDKISFAQVAFVNSPKKMLEKKFGSH